jgi:hypothetical protein
MTETTNNYVNMYQPIRDGYAAGYVRGETFGWRQSSITTRNRIRNTLNDYLNDGEHSQVTIQSIDFTVEMTTIAPTDSENAVQYNLSGELVILIPYKFLWVDLPPIQQTVNVNSTWRQRF